MYVVLSAIMMYPAMNVFGSFWMSLFVCSFMCAINVVIEIDKSKL